MHLSHLASIGVRQRDVHRETAGNARQKKKPRRITAPSQRSCSLCRLAISECFHLIVGLLDVGLLFLKKRPNGRTYRARFL
jgi:hypothetical protein